MLPADCYTIVTTMITPTQTQSSTFKAEYHPAYIWRVSIVAALWAACFLLTDTFPMLNAKLGAARTFALCAVLCVAGFIFIL